ncbi:MAG: sensor histidine kinase [Lachnospiraceae bacterium]|nr:sensor histidine kinase [Lachnospiraceae bacterium]
MKHEKISIKWKIFLYLSAFVIILLAVLWLLQICYLDTFYKFVTTKTAKHVKTQAIEKLLKNSEKIDEELDLLAAKNNFAIYVTNFRGEPLYNAEYIATSRLNTLPKEAFERFYREAKENGGSAEISIKGEREAFFGEKPPKENMHNDDKALDRHMDMPPEFVQNHGQEAAESVIFVEILQVDGEEKVFFLNCVLTPVDATVNTLKIELVCISVLMIVLAIGLALLISKNVSGSMIRMSESAKGLAKGNFDVVFDGRDYREIAELSDILNYTAKELGQTERLRQELVANVSHDLRTPLTMIIAYAQAMQDLPGENTPENIQVVVDEAERLTNLVNDMLDLSKLQAGVLEKNSECFDFTDCIHSVLQRYNKLIEQGGYKILFLYDTSVWIDGDEFKMCQVLYNLINNAVNYTGEDKTIIVRQILTENKVRIEIEDSGEGIAKEDIPYVWDRYYKVDKTHKRAVTGTGLGLSIVKNILELHEASYGVESDIGKGSIFWFEMKTEKMTDESMR